MPDIQDLKSMIRGPVPEKPLPAIWDFAPCHASLVDGISDMRDYYCDVEYRTELQLRLRERFPDVIVLPGVWPDLGVIIEASAFGGMITWFQNGAPYIHPSVTDLKQVDSLKVPDPEFAGIMPLYLSQLKQTRRLLRSKGTDMENLIITMGPAEITGLILGYDRYFLGFYMDPDRVLKLTECVTEMVIRWLHIQEEVLGKADLVIMGEHQPAQVNAEQLEQFMLPYIKAVFDEFPHAVKLYHNEGFHSEKHIELMQRTGYDIWHFGSDQHEVAELFPQLNENICLFGGLSPHGVLRQGTPEETRAEAEACVKAARGRRYILSSGTGTTPDVPPENFRAMVDAAL